jgi:hypothetical protein
VFNEESIQVPTRPFVYQSLQECEARFLNRPKIKEILNQGKKFQVLKEMWDIGDALGVGEVTGVDKKNFLMGQKMSYDYHGGKLFSN